MKRWALLLVMLVAAACGEDFDPYYRLTGPRVLALRSEPVAPAHDETTTLSALVYTPPGASVDGYAWSWCPFAGSANDGYPCLVTEADLAALGGGAAASVPPFDLGHGETATLKNSIDPTLLQTVCAGVNGQPALVDCADGFPAQVKVVVRAGGHEVTTVRTLRLRFAEGQPANANPTIDGLLADVGGTDQPLDGITLPRRQKTPVRAQVPETSSETFGDGEREHIILSWFVESGDLDEERTAYIDGVVTLDKAVVNKWEPDDAHDYPPSTSDMFVVVRDGRDGVSWIRAKAVLQ